MRLSSAQQQQIKKTLKQYFGSTSRIWLFGSRVDDQARGGDIGLYIEPEVQSADEIVDAKLKALAQLHLRLGDQKIDLVVHRKKGPQLPIHQIARETGVEL